MTTGNSKLFEQKIILTPSQAKFLLEVVEHYKVNKSPFRLGGKLKRKMAEVLYHHMLLDVDEDDTWATPTEQGLAFAIKHQENKAKDAARQNRWERVGETGKKANSKKGFNQGRRKSADEGPPRPFTLECSVSTPCHHPRRLSLKLWDGDLNKAKEFMVPTHHWHHTFMATSFREARIKLRESGVAKMEVNPKIKPDLSLLPN